MKPSLTSVESPSPFRSRATNSIRSEASPGLLPLRLLTKDMLAAAALAWRAGNAAVVGMAIGATFFLGAGPMKVAAPSFWIDEAAVVTWSKKVAPELEIFI